eukprot:contig_14123_g3386
MVAQVAARGCPLLGLPAYPELVDQMRRFRAAGWGSVEAVDAHTFFYRYLPPDRREHILSRERLDNEGEWHLFLRHYALVRGALDRQHEAAGPPTRRRCRGGALHGGAPGKAVADGGHGKRVSPFVTTFLTFFADEGSA